MRQLQTYISTLLIATILMSSQAMAMVRGLPMAVGYMELCAGHAMLVVAIDSDGQPTHDPSHRCPECLLAALDLTIDAGFVEISPIERPRATLGRPALKIKRVQAIFVKARAPPFWI